MSPVVDLRCWAPRKLVPPGIELVVLAVDPWNGNVWVGWIEEDGTKARALTHESALEHVSPMRRRKLDAS